MTQSEFFALADQLGTEAGVREGAHGYFVQHQTRLWGTASHFGLPNMRGKRVLEIGPFFSYIPFLLQKNGNQVTVLEGDDPAVDPLKPLYQKANIPVVICDLADTFLTSHAQQHRLPFPDESFDLITCWETMEHFNFNPVGFVRELRRILRPGGQALITVPNVAKFDHRVKLALGQTIGPEISSYQTFYDYHGGKFLGWHWREYTLSEISHLFAAEKFTIRSAKHLLAFHQKGSGGIRTAIRRTVGIIGFKLAPSTGTICAITAEKA